MRYDRLCRKHPDYHGEALQTYGDLFSGGAEFRKRIDKYLVQNDLEPNAVFKKRCKVAHYINYAGPIAGYFASRLFDSKPTVKAGDNRALDASYTGFKENCDGTGTDLDVFLGERVVEAMVKRTAFWRVEFGGEPEEGMTIDQAEAAGLRAARLKHIPTEEIINWRAVRVGRDRYRYLWLLQHERVSEILEIDDAHATVTETWTLYRADGSIRRWQIEYLDEKENYPKPDAEIPEVTEGLPYNPTDDLPVVALRLPDHLYLAEHVGEAQLEHFRHRCAQSWAIQRSAFTMPWFTLADRRKPPTMGTGYYGILGFTKAGNPETVSWPGPSSVPFEVMKSYVEGLKDEIHRVAHQMSRGINNNAAAVGRSAASKQSDNEATDAVLREFARFALRALEDTYHLVAEGRGEDLTFHVGGMDRYNLPDPTGLATSAQLVTMNPDMVSPTGRQELAKRLWSEILPDLDEETRQRIVEETEALVTKDRTVLPIPPPPGASPGGAPTPPKGTP